ncbi:MAG: prolipoprotein diacylglyceryl transferase [Verrucomicrobiaceae bacterium]|nr:prolipoprotein diacylglyceryl transferase [Verrucomicrobiaceae bacterium]
MVPYLDLPPLQVGGHSFGVFGLLVWVGIITGYFVARWQARRVGLDSQIVSSLVAVCAFFGLLGSHWVFLFVYHPEVFRADPWSLIQIWQGMSSYGGMFTSALAGAIFVRWLRVPFLPYADVCVFTFFHVWFFGRLGCTTAHDHPGCPSQFWLAVKFPDTPRHDLGLYEWLLCFLWLPLVHWLGRKERIASSPPGTLLHIMLIAYAVPRFFLDFLRATDLPSCDVRYGGLTPAQYGCIVFVLIACRFFVRRNRSSSALNAAS